MYLPPEVLDSPLNVAVVRSGDKTILIDSGLGTEFPPDFSRTVKPSPIPDVLRRTATQFLDVYRSQLRPFETENEVAPGVLLRRTGGHTPGHSIVRIESGGAALTFAGHAVFQPGVDQPEWQNGFEHARRNRPASGYGS